MSGEDIKCVLLADRHHGLTESVRGMLETLFDAVVMVADESSLIESARRLRPTLAVVDLSLAPGDNLRWLEQLRARCPELKILVLSVHDEPSVHRAVLDAGADGVVVKRAIATELLTAIDKILSGPGNPTPNVTDPPAPHASPLPQQPKRLNKP
ncbi:MAG TPA: response regulator transcription factor [Verrucomicrobiota bacterium]|nr:response regulator transcription factor [Verrucomicrobiota bacterium]HNU52177.1 response regulator transcription factor [Verrucomicrobiota bacterium]